MKKIFIALLIISCNSRPCRYITYIDFNDGNQVRLVDYNYSNYRLVSGCVYSYYNHHMPNALYCNVTKIQTIQQYY